MGNVTFERPPLNEVSFGLFFAPLADLRTSHFGSFWARLRPDFDQTADKPPVGGAEGLQMVGGAEWFPLPRVWFVHKDKEQLIQLQPNRFYFNWRRVKPATAYPRFDSLQPLFCKYLDAFTAFLQAESLGVPDITGAELIYVNHIPVGEGWSELNEIGGVFPDLAWRRRTSKAIEVKGFAWHGSLQTSDARLEVDIKTAQSADDGKQLFLFELRALSRNKPGSTDGVRKWFDTANGTIVSAFQDLTSEHMQKEIWRRVDR